VALPPQRDLTEARDVIRTWLAARRPEAGALEISELSSPGLTGFSNETLIFEASWQVGGEARREPLVIRVQPTGFRIFLEDNFDQQYRVLAELGERGAPIPKVYDFEADPGVLGAPFFLMRREPGQAPGDVPPYNAEGFIFDMAPAQRRELWLSAMEAFTRIHAESLAGGFEYLAQPERGPTGLDQMLHYWEESFRWAAEGRTQPVAEAAWEWLGTRRPGASPTALSWGDSRVANMLFEGTSCTAVLDWEMVSLGGPEMDLGWWLFLDHWSAESFGLTRLDGLGTRQETIDLWSERTGLVPQDLEFYEVFAGFRFAVIMMRMARLLKEWDFLDSAADMETNNGATQVLARMLDLPPPGEPWTV
jgi:aminoglycoside phosphotransferase (APT) family kinase protein